MDETTRIALNELSERMERIERREEAERAETAAPPFELFPEEEEEMGGGGGGGTQEKGGLFDWDPGAKTIGAGGCMVGRTWHSTGETNPMGDGTYWLKVTLTDDGVMLRVVESVEKGETTDSVCYVPIYTIENGEIKTDLRGAFMVPCWE